MNHLLPALEHISYAIRLFLHFTTRFDTLDQNILFSKLYRHVIRGKALNLIMSYRTDRKQKVHVVKIVSDIGNKKFGGYSSVKERTIVFLHLLKRFKLHLRK